jgi:hypothetical protein
MELGLSSSVPGAMPPASCTEQNHLLIENVDVVGEPHASGLPGKACLGFGARAKVVLLGVGAMALLGVVMTFAAPSSAPTGASDELVSRELQDAEWVLGKQNDDCVNTCNAVGKTCNQQVLMTITKGSEIIDVARQVGKTCQSNYLATIGWAYETNPGICTNPACCVAGNPNAKEEDKCQGICAFGLNPKRNCDARSPAYSRLCPCS